MHDRSYAAMQRKKKCIFAIFAYNTLPNTQKHKKVFAAFINKVNFSSERRFKCNFMLHLHFAECVLIPSTKL